MTALLVVTNAEAGSAHADRVDAALAVLRAGADVEVAQTGTPADLDDTLDRRAGRPLVVCGGDGSLHVVVAALHRRGELGDAVLGLVPLGTGNDRARSLGIPLDPVAAARVVLTGEPQPLELLEDDAGGVAVNAVHAGVGAEASRRASSLKGRLGAAAYAVGSVVAGTSAAGWRLRVEADARVLADVDRRVLQVGLGLGTTVGGGSPLTPDARPDDGLVDVVVSFAVGPLARVGYALRLRKGEHLQRPDVVGARARSVTVSGEPYPVNADGELDGPVRRRTWTVRPAAWRLVCPPQGVS